MLPKTAQPPIPHLHDDNSPAAIRDDILENLFSNLAKFPGVATRHDYYMALSYAVRDRLLQRWIQSARTYLEQETRTVIYLSAEYLLGPQLLNNLVNLGILAPAREAVASLGLDLDTLIAEEEEPGLGNGGLGRLAACYMDSLATLEVPAIGYGIRYEFGIFDQAIRDGWQVEVSDRWLRLGYPWEIQRPEIAHRVRLGGRTEHSTDDRGRLVVRWVPERVVMGIPCDTPVLGNGVNTANFLRLWKAEADEALDLEAFNQGDYFRAVQEKVLSENITKVLYPRDESLAGKRLRLEQQYFFVSASLQDLLRLYLQKRKDLDRLHEKFVIQLNDTHPALAVAELMRLLVDEHGLPWEAAWETTRQTFAYTNHTLLPEALERWPLPLFQSVLPRPLEIIYEINQRFLDDVRARFPGDEERVKNLSLIEEEPTKMVRMANLACVGSRAINGVAQLHSELLKATVLRDFAHLWPERFTNVTNGVTPRRFVALCNPRLAALLDEVLGPAWVRDLDRLRGLERFAKDAAFGERWRAIKRENKVQLAAKVRELTGVSIDPLSCFDAQFKRIHEYKRQHLNVLHILARYLLLKRDPRASFAPRTFLFGGKAAPGYTMAKLMIKLIHAAADLVNSDPQVNDRLRVAFFPDFNVKNAEGIYPAADLSEQISTAGKEASGTGNMKFALNGALTIGTLDGANIEIREAVGAENFFLFGLTADEVAGWRARGYHPWEIVEKDPLLGEIIELLRSDAMSRGHQGLFDPLINSITGDDPFFVLADFRAYLDGQDEVSRVWGLPRAWTEKSILNVARMGYFSSDRAVREYCERIWNVEPVHINQP